MALTTHIMVLKPDFLCSFPDRLRALKPEDLKVKVTILHDILYTYLTLTIKQTEKPDVPLP